MPTESSARGSARKRLLIVDDTRQNIAILADALKSEYSIGFALDGEQALDYVAKTVPDLILLDVMMPKMDGYEVCARLKADAGTKGIPVVFLTAVEDVSSKARCFSLGAVDYVTKPFEPLEVQARVRTHLAIENYRRELEAANRQLSAWKARVQSEIRAAQAVQRQILPKDLPAPTGFEIRAFFEPCVETAGDYYQFFALPDGGTLAAIFDVSGKGLGAAMIALSIHTYLRLQVTKARDLSELTQGLNQFLVGITGDDAFATGFLLRLGADGELSYVNAGHPPAIHLTSRGTELLSRTGPLLGVARCAPCFEESRFSLAPGELLCVYTDGFDETFSAERQLFGLDRLRASVEEARGRTTSDALAHVRGRIRDFQGDGPSSDDRTMVLISTRS